MRRLLLYCAFVVSLVASAPAATQARFAPPIKYLVGSGPNCVSAVDLNNDGKFDLVVTTQNDANVYVLMGRGDGTFDNPVAYPVGTGTNVGSVVGDFNGDGKLDVAVVTYSTTASQVLVLLGNGNGTFASSPIVSATTLSAMSVKMADINNDGYPDLLLGGFTPTLLYGNGDGTFGSPVVLPIPATPTGIFDIPRITSGDLDSDGHMDVIGLASGSNVSAVVVYLQNSDGSFQPPVGYLHARFSNPASDIFVSDISRDGFLDVLATYDSFLDVYKGLGDGTVAIPTTTQYLGSTPIGLVFADFNGDGTMDIAAADFNSSRFGAPAGFGVTVLPVEADGTFATAALRQFDVGAQAVSIATADFNGDGKPDLVTANPATNSISVLLNGAATIVTLSALPNPAMPGNSVTLTSTVSAATGNPPPATGTIAFYDGNVSLGSASLDLNGTATLNFSPSTGLHTVSALYFGDSQHIGSSSPSIIVSVGYPTTTTLNYAPPSPLQGQTITFSASASSAYGSVNPGIFRFFEGTRILGTVTLSNGAASFPYSSLPIGQHTITATYYSTASGSTLLTSSASVTFTVAFNSTTTVAASASAPRASTPVSLAATVSAISGTPTGNVTFSDGATILGSAALTNGTATVVTSSLVAGSRTIHVAYEGDGIYSPSATDLSLQVADAGSAAPMAGSYDVVPVGPTNTVLYEPVRKRVYVVNSNYARIDVIDAQTRSIIGKIPAGSVNSIDVTADGAFLFIGTSYGSLMKVDTQSLLLVANYVSPSLSFTIMKVLSDATILALPTYGHVMRWNPVTGAVTDLGVSANAISTSGDHKKAVFANYGVISVFDATSGTITATKTYSGGYFGYGTVAVNGDGSSIAVNGSSFISVLNGSLFEQYQITNNGSMPVLAADASKLYVPNGSYTVAVYDVATGNLLANYPTLYLNGYSSGVNFQAVTETGILIGVTGPGVAFMDPSRATPVTVPTSSPWGIFSITPTLGPANSATVVTTQLAALSVVYFGSGVSQPTSTINLNQLLLAPPSSVTGPVNILAIQGNNFPDMIVNGFSYGPKIDRIETTGGSADGGSTLRLYGYGFGNTPTVMVGGVNATAVAVTTAGGYNEIPSLQLLTATTPAGTPGAVVDITVSNNAGTVTAASAYTYLKAVHTYTKGGPLTALFYDSARKFVYIANSSKLEIFDVVSRTFKSPIYPSTATANTVLGRMALNADGSRLVVSDYGEMLLHIINPDTGDSTSVSLAQFKDPNSSSLMVVNSIALMSDGRMMIVLQQSGCSGCSYPLAILDLNSNSLTVVPATSNNSLAPLVPVQGGARIMAGVAGAYDVAAQVFLPGSGISYSYGDGGGFSSNGRHGLGPGTQLYDENLRALQNLNNQGMSDWGSGTLRFLPGSGLLLRTSSYGNPFVDLFDVNTGWLRGRIALPEAPKQFSYNDASHSAGIVTDESGGTWFISTATGLTIVQLQKLPLSIGGVDPERNTTDGGYQGSISGSGFTASTTLNIGDQSVSATYLGENTLTFTAPALANGCYAVTVANPGGESYTVPCGYNVPAGAGTPVLTSIDPVTGTAPVLSVTLNATGTNFTADSQITFNGVPLFTTFLSPTSLQAKASTSGLAGNYSVAVQNPNPGGGTSNTKTYSVTNPQPSIYGTTPNVIFTGSPTQTVSMNGYNFVPNSTLTFDGTARAVTYLNSSRLQFTVTAAEAATSGTHSLSVTNPVPGGGSANGTLKVVDKLPALMFGANSPYQLGDAAVGTTGNQVPISIGNTGYDTLNVTSVSVSGDFQITSTTCTNASISANTYYGCYVYVAFAPTSVGTSTGTLTVVDNSPGSPHTLTLTGNGVANVPVSNYPSSFNFGTSNVGAPLIWGMSITNIGYGTLHISTTSLTGSDFSLTSNTCTNAALTRFAYCYINIQFNPTAAGTRNGSITINDDLAGSPHVVNLSGIGINGVASWSITSVNFDPVLIGSPGASLQVTLTNTGSAPLTFGGFNVTGDFTESNNCPNTLSVSASCTVTITFRPKTLGLKSGSMTVLSGGQQPISLAGTGADLALNLERVLRPTRGETPAAPVAQVVSIASAARTSVSLTCDGAPADAICSLSTSSLQLSGKAPSLVQLQLRNQAGKALADGVYTVRLTASVGSLVRTVDVPLAVASDQKPDLTVAQHLTSTSNSIRAKAPTTGEQPETKAGTPFFVTPPPTALRATPEALEFSAEKTQQEIRIFNVSAMTLEKLTIEAPAGFDQTSDCSESLPVGASCMVKVTARAETRTNGTLQITAGSSSAKVALRLK